MVRCPEGEGTGHSSLGQWEDKGLGAVSHKAQESKADGWRNPKSLITAWLSVPEKPQPFSEH